MWRAHRGGRYALSEAYERQRMHACVHARVRSLARPRETRTSARETYLPEVQGPLNP